jgi:hypothetical protein
MDSASSQHPTGTLPQAVRRDFSGVGCEEAVARAREPILRERAQAAAALRLQFRHRRRGVRPACAGRRLANPTM